MDSNEKFDFSRLKKIQYEKEKMKKKVYKKIYENHVLQHIDKVSTRGYTSALIFMPEHYIGYPVYNREGCCKYIIKKLNKSKAFNKVELVNNNFIGVDWTVEFKED